MFSEIGENNYDEGYFDKKLILRAEELEKTNNRKTIEGEYVLHYKERKKE